MFSSALFGFLIGFGVGSILVTYAIYKFARGLWSATGAVFALLWGTIGGSAGMIGRIVNGAIFSGIIAWHSLFDLNKDNLLDIQFADDFAKWLASKHVWPSIKANIDEYPIGIATFFVWGARAIGLDTSGLDPAKYPFGASSTPPPPPALVT